MTAYEKYNALYDHLFSLGDCTKAQQSRLAIVLYNMVLASDEECLAHDLSNYRRFAITGQSYLDRHNLTLSPSFSELSDLAKEMGC
jgi:predicted SprT family Zn-dependent metalloprotease